MWLKLHIVQAEKEEDPIKKIHTDDSYIDDSLCHEIRRDTTSEVKLREPVRLLKTLLYITFAWHQYSNDVH